MRSRLSAFRSTIDRATITRYVKLSLSLCVYRHWETNYNRKRDIGTRYSADTDPSDDVFIGVSSIRYYRRHRILYPRRAHVSLFARVMA